MSKEWIDPSERSSWTTNRLRGRFCARNSRSCRASIPRSVKRPAVTRLCARSWSSSPDLVFLDLQMPQVDGFEVIRRLSGTRLPAVVIVTAFEQHAIEAFEAGAIDYLLKPVRAERLKKSVERARDLTGKPLRIAQSLAKIASIAGAKRHRRRRLRNMARAASWWAALAAIISCSTSMKCWRCRPRGNWFGSLPRNGASSHLETLRAVETTLPTPCFPARSPQCDREHEPCQANDRADQPPVDFDAEQSSGTGSE